MSYLWDLSHIHPQTEIVLPGDTIPAIFWNAVQKRGPNVWMRQKEFGIWRSWSWNQTAEAVREIAHGLMALGFAPHETASILSNTTVEWVLADLAVLSAGGVSNGIYPTDAADQVQFLCEDSGTTVLFVEDDEQLDKVLEVRQHLPRLKKIVVFDMEGLHELNDPQVISLDALRELGRTHAKTHAGEMETRVAACRPQDLAILVYTSGTTGKPKGAMHSHRGLVYTVHGYNTLIARDEHDECMCFLPLCHIAERMGGEYFSLYTGAKLNFVENPETVPENVREIAPTVFTAVPRVWEKFYSGVMITLKEASQLQQAAYAWAIGIGQRVAELVMAGQPVPGGLRVQFRLARLLVLDNVRKLIGIHRARFLVTGAAPISPDLVRWYLALGVPMLEVWGMTETCGASTGIPADRIKPGSIGPAASYNEVRLDPQTSEILVRGPNVFMGYLNLPEKTAETIDADGWLHTGDVGVVDEEGFFRITDRMKDIIITAGGKNITPSELENELKFSPYVTDAVVIGDKRAYLTVIIMIDQENVEKYAQDTDVPFSNYASLTRAPEVQALIQAEIDRVNKKFARVEQIKKFFLLDTQLSAEDEELTPTMKLKRKLVQQKYAGQIDAMYS
ncbi:MAG: long-chain fatty acid--CoA ligase [Gammaproteobacteria bacterium]|uniref:AMP-dependent synthetase/ligase n=1 Tax=Hydrogenophaga sp. TaxID=1904254 RepID=UPI0025BB6213|nr:long-chain fatty acid--CoA ligase [Hydrogenophaga sp.]MBU4180293.1 long-chain fatty acid--CoA ligase [Gammaproteobacteria bacterium]MBU4278937.1 long-chain fatty acid--CoA ligase [Gammaproteobacteria bacterium]MBU4322593.1 long-chain fatty acid--CoA ligase [Gammaproteobacteria bacterium]MBU4508654.1 long-chain fatty acid--CoA ligase [Gammaproteobacteria bacterium]MCG2657998.1 long-chain fatty acid--CoA ligase [Hydrogenophaga sp.]